MLGRKERHSQDRKQVHMRFRKERHKQDHMHFRKEQHSQDRKLEHSKRRQVHSKMISPYGTCHATCRAIQRVACVV